MTIRRGLIMGLAVCAMSLPLWAREGIVKTRDGTSYQGDVTEGGDDGKVVIKVHGIDMKLDRHDIASIEYIDDAAGDFQKKLAALPPRDVTSRLDLANKELSQKHYDQARQAAQAALDIDPNSADATATLTMIRKQQALDKTTKAADPKPPIGQDTLVPDQPLIPTPAPANVPVDQKYLAADDINIVKQMELGADESGFNVKFLNDVRRKFVMKDNSGTLAEFMALPNWKQARYILSRTPEMRNDVRILSDPASIAGFKAHVQPTLLNGCATSGCHNAGSGNAFILYAPAENDAITYTNFYILSQYTKTIDKTSLQMIDRTSPKKSLLLQFSLPADVADYKHPDVPNYHGAVHSPADPRYKAMSDWLSTALEPIAPDYGIKYTPSGSPAPTTKPAGK